MPRRSVAFAACAARSRTEASSSLLAEGNTRHAPRRDGLRSCCRARPGPNPGVTAISHIAAGSALILRKSSRARAPRPPPPPSAVALSASQGRIRGAAAGTTWILPRVNACQRGRGTTRSVVEGALALTPRNPAGSSAP
jgi:hypothetical protein